MSFEDDNVTRGKQKKTDVNAPKIKGRSSTTFLFVWMNCVV